MPNEPSFMTFFHLPSEFNHVLCELWINHLSRSKVTTDSVNWSRTHPSRWLPPLTGCNRRDVRLGARDPPPTTRLYMHRWSVMTFSIWHQKHLKNIKSTSMKENKQTNWTLLKFKIKTLKTSDLPKAWFRESKDEPQAGRNPCKWHSWQRPGI